MTNAIDIVIPWVDGNDPVHSANRMKHITKSDESLEDTGGTSRFSSIGEIFYCILSINRFARFVRKIFIVTDGQDPHIEKQLSAMLPEGMIPMEIVDHKVIFRGYEEYLPTFNSRAIEAMIWRIPGLSERFILMNDDFLITGKVGPEDFFQGEKTVCYAKMYPTWWAKLMRRLRPSRKGHKRISFKDSMINAVDIMGGSSRFMFLGHTPRALRKSFYEDFFENREDVMVRNIRHRFRHADQFNSQELFYISEYKQGRCIVKNTSDSLIYLMPKKKKGYIDR
ncbi:MAG: Stealth CR1 domain-containing protein [Bacteroidales bacterium]|nr:Stealth CR1 domain-containing protein [Bacteroidales bacterium]